MKGLILSLAVGIIITVAVFPAMGALVDPQVLSNTNEQDMLNVTVSILIFTPHPEMANREIMTRGTGTLVAHSGQNLILTHDHWEVIPETSTRARFLDADGRLLVEMGRKSFAALIRYQVGVSMLLSAPEGLIPDTLSSRTRRCIQVTMTTAALADGTEVKVGSVLLLARHIPQSDHQIGLLETVVEAVEVNDEHRILTLHSVNGTAVVPGDWDGGIWMDGRLIGNLWSRLLVQDLAGNTIEATDLMLAAIHPLG